MLLNSVLRFCAAVGVTLSSYASIEVKNGSFIGCTPSHKNTELHRPQSYPRYNNLTKTISGLPNEYASKIILRGIVVDKHCLPISDAAIKIWQHDEYGDVRYIKDEAFSYKKYDMNYHMYREVNGAGKIYSNNNGQFAFITMPPGRYVNNKDSKYIRISISHMNYLPIDSQIVLTKGDLIDKHSITANFNKADSAFYGVEVYDFKIVISANNKYRKY